MTTGEYYYLLYQISHLNFCNFFKRLKTKMLPETFLKLCLAWAPSHFRPKNIICMVIPRDKLLGIINTSLLAVAVQDH